MLLGSGLRSHFPPFVSSRASYLRLYEFFMAFRRLAVLFQGKLAATSFPVPVFFLDANLSFRGLPDRKRPPFPAFFLGGFSSFFTLAPSITKDFCGLQKICFDFIVFRLSVYSFVDISPPCVSNLLFSPPSPKLYPLWFFFSDPTPSFSFPYFFREEPHPLLL